MPRRPLFILRGTGRLFDADEPVFMLLRHLYVIAHRVLILHAFSSFAYGIIVNKKVPIYLVKAIAFLIFHDKIYLQSFK